MPWKDIIECLQAGEGDKVEFLSSVDSLEQLAKIITSFLNHSGGRIIIGVDDKNDHLIGSNVSKSFIENTQSKIDPRTQLNIEEINRLDKKILLIKVPDGAMKPYSYRNKYYYRDQLSVRKVNKDDIYNITGGEKKTTLNQRQEQTLKYLKTHEKITNREYRDLYNVSHKTAHIELTELTTYGQIEKYGQGRNTAYKLL